MQLGKLTDIEIMRVVIGYELVQFQPGFPNMKINEDKTKEKYYHETDEAGTIRYYSSKDHNKYLHRVDGPAIEYPDGYKVWYLNGKPHRIDGPAIEHPNGSKEWYLNGIYHRIDGPAIEYSDGYKVWWFNGKRYGIEDLNEWPLQLYLGYIKWKKNN